MPERIGQFEQRKRDHLRIALDSRAQSSQGTGLDAIELIHEALPDLNFEDISTESSFQGRALSAPYFISSMTAGHENGRRVNLELARFSARRRLLMGVGSQRRELTDKTASEEWTAIRREAPGALLLGNLGLAQIIHASTDDVRRLVESLQALALFIHLNPLQECLQPEGTPHFKGGLQAIEKLAKTMGVPIIVKETGCGFSAKTLKRLEASGVHAVDLAGLGGTHWGRVEGLRVPAGDVREGAAKSFADWGISTLESLANARDAEVSYEIWASGGVRTGVDVAKLIALGAKKVGLAQPWLEAFASNGGGIGFSTSPADDVAATLDRTADRLQFELKTSMFCTGSGTLEALSTQECWSWRNR